MARLRLNNVGDPTGATNPITLSSGVTTTVSWTSAPPFATITGSDYYVLVAEPGTANEEIMYLTAYTAGATSGTVTRAQEGTAGIAHAATGWAHSPTAQDFAVANTLVTTVTSYTGVNPCIMPIANSSFLPSSSTARIEVDVSGIVSGPSRWSFFLFYGPSASLISATGNPTVGTTQVQIGSIPMDTDGGTARGTVQVTGLTPGTRYYWALAGGPIGYAITYPVGTASAASYGIDLSPDESMLAVCNYADNTVCVLRRGEARQVQGDPRRSTPLENNAVFSGTTVLDQPIYSLPCGAGSNPLFCAFSPDGSQLAVALNTLTTNSVLFFSMTNGLLLGQVSIANPTGIAWVGNTCWVGNQAAGTAVPVVVTAGTTYTPGTAVNIGATAGLVNICTNHTTCHLTAPIANGATGITTLNVDSIPKALANGDSLVLFSNGLTQTVTVNGAQAASTTPTTITVTSFTATNAYPIGTSATDLNTSRLYAANAAPTVSNIYIVSNLTGTPSVATTSLTTYGTVGGSLVCTGPGVSPEKVYCIVTGGTNPTVVGMTTSNNTIVSNQTVAANPLMIDLFSDGQSAWITHSPGNAGAVVSTQINFSSSPLGAGVYVTSVGSNFSVNGSPAPTSLSGVKVVPSSGTIYLAFYQGAGAQGFVWEYFGSSFTIAAGAFYDDQAVVTVSGL